jgi:hypothetical protein
MVFWSDIETDRIEMTQIKDRTKFRYDGGPLRFQVPRGECTWGVNSYKSFQIDVSDPDFIQWWRALETRLCPAAGPPAGPPFNSNLKESSLRIKIDDSVYIFDQNSKQINPEVKEGLFRGQELSCLIDIDSTYFYNGNLGLTIRAYQIKTLTDGSAQLPDEEAPVEEAPVALQPGVCAFLPM